MFRQLPSPVALRAFESAARLGSFKKAAEELSVTPTAISHQIRGLEAHLGIALFVRKTRSVDLTAQGAQLAKTVHGSLSQISNTIDELVETETTLTISTTPAFAALWLMPKVATFQQKHPEIKLRFDTSTERVHLNKDKRIDIVIRYGLKVYEDWVQTPLGEETFGVYGTPSFIEELSNQKHVNLLEVKWQQPDLQQITWSQWLAKSTDTLPINKQALEYDQEHFAINAALGNQGLVLASSMLVRDYVKHKWLVPYNRDVTLTGMSYSAYCLPEKARLLKVRLFNDWLRSLPDT